MFILHPQLSQDTYTVGFMPLSQILMSRDANYPWFILVPQRANVAEIHHLTAKDRQQFLKESVLLSEAMEELFKPDKLNVAALGNMVSQLHVHHVARYKTDPAWPKPVWGAVAPTEYEEQLLQQRLQLIEQRLTETEEFIPPG